MGLFNWIFDRDLLQQILFLKFLLNISQLHLFNKTLRSQSLKRPNRFLIQWTWEERILSAFLPNSRRLQELRLPGRIIYLMKEEKSPERKTFYTAVAVDRDSHPIMLHTHCTNEVALV